MGAAPGEPGSAHTYGHRTPYQAVQEVSARMEW